MFDELFIERVSFKKHEFILKILNLGPRIEEQGEDIWAAQYVRFLGPLLHTCRLWVLCQGASPLRVFLCAYRKVVTLIVLRLLYIS